MADEAQVRCFLSVRKVSGQTTMIDYQSRPGSFNAAVAGTKGPVPGAFQASTIGTDVDLSQLTTPGLCRIMNQDPTNMVSVGVFDPDSNKFFALMDLLPGESYVVRLSQSLVRDISGPGTGSSGSNNRLRVTADIASCNVLVEAFET